MLRVTECVRIRLRPGDRTGYLRSVDLTPDSFSGLGWGDSSESADKRVVIDLGLMTGFASGCAELIARELVSAGVTIVQVEGSHKANVRAAFRGALTTAISECESVLR